MPRQTRCVDCNAAGTVTPRAALKPGPRCDEHWRERKRAVSKKAHANRIEEDFGITGELYWELYEYQGGRCYICQRATGKSRRLAVDHDHNCTAGHDPKRGCPQCIRGLLCSPCNKDLIGRYDDEALQRAIEYRKHPPAQEFLFALGMLMARNVLAGIESGIDISSTTVGDEL